MNKYATFESYWKAEMAGSFGTVPVMELAFKEVAEKAWKAATQVAPSVTTYPNGEGFIIGDAGIKIWSSVMNNSVRSTRFKKIGEFRTPKNGEWYLSGALPHAYMARADLNTKYHILVRFP